MAPTSVCRAPCSHSPVGPGLCSCQDVPPSATNTPLCELGTGFFLLLGTAASRKIPLWCHFTSLARLGAGAGGGSGCSGSDRRERRTGRHSPWFGFHSTMVTVGAHTRDMSQLRSPLLLGSAARPYLHPPCPMQWHHPPNPRCICQPPLPLLLPLSLQLKQEK